MILARALALAVLAIAPSAAAAPPSEWLQRAVDLLCPGPPPRGMAAEAILAGAWLLREEPADGSSERGRLRQWFALPDGLELRTDRQAPAGQLRRFTAEIWRSTDGELEPVAQALADGACLVGSGRRLLRPAPDRLQLVQLDGDLETVRWTETLKTPWPADGTDPGGPRIALIDSGLAYDLPIFRDRLARGADGVPLGYDYWDLDALPYDADFARGPFLPIRHGTAVAAILIYEAPTAALMPLRYPRPDMARLGDAVAYAASHGARVLSMPLGSSEPEDWQAFAAAMAQHPELLAIVSAGNNGRNVDLEPLWPGDLDLENMVVVTSADAFGRLAPGSNWGPRSVDLMLPAENLTTIDFRGAQVRASGSSYAVPRLAALAARLLDTRPDLSSSELKAALFARAIPSPYAGDVVAVGWIPDPAAD